MWIFLHQCTVRGKNYKIHCKYLPLVAGFFERARSRCCIRFKKNMKWNGPTHKPVPFTNRPRLWNQNEKYQKKTKYDFFFEIPTFQKISVCGCDFVNIYYTITNYLHKKLLLTFSTMPAAILTI